MKINTVISRPLAELAELKVAAARLTEWGFEAEVLLEVVPTRRAMLRTNAQVRTVRKARAASLDGNIGALNAMMAEVIGKTKGVNLPLCEVKTK